MFCFLIKSYTFSYFISNVIVTKTSGVVKTYSMSIENSVFSLGNPFKFSPTTTGEKLRKVTVRICHVLPTFSNVHQETGSLFRNKTQYYWFMQVIVFFKLTNVYFFIKPFVTSLRTDRFSQFFLHNINYSINELYCTDTNVKLFAGAMFR